MKSIYEAKTIFLWTDGKKAIGDAAEETIESLRIECLSSSPEILAQNRAAEVSGKVTV